MSTNETNAAPESKYAAKRKNRVAEANNNVVADTTQQDATYDNKHFKHKDKGIPETALRYPEHIRNIAIILKNNAEIRRFTAIGILNYLKQKGEVIGDNKYVSFKWNKFAVKSNGLMREYNYTEPFFINCFVASFSSFSASAQRILNIFIQKEMSKNLNNIVDTDDINEIVESNEAYIESNNNKEITE